MTDSWKGEHLIRSIKPENNRKEATRLSNVIYHAQRRKAGVPTAGAKKHAALVMSALVASAVRDT